MEQWVRQRGDFLGVVRAVMLLSITMAGAIACRDSNGRYPHLQAAKLHFQRGQLSDAEIAIRDAFLYDAIPEPTEREAWILRAKIQAGLHGDPVAVEAVNILEQMYGSRLHEGERADLSKWFKSTGCARASTAIEEGGRSK
jgi:hypothetical protein